MDEKELDALREEFENSDLSDDIAEAEWDNVVTPSPMVGITVRLPAEVLQHVRERAATENVKTTALIRRWIEEALERSANSTTATGVLPGLRRSGRQAIPAITSRAATWHSLDVEGSWTVVVHNVKASSAQTIERMDSIETLDLTALGRVRATV